MRGKLHHLVMVCSKLIEFAGKITLRLSNAPGDMKDLVFISDIINETLHEVGVWWFSFKRKSRTSSTTTVRR